MRKLIVPLVLIAALAAPSLAFAAAQTTEGMIKAIDAKAMTITLVDGTVYRLPVAYKLADLKTGEKVKITWDRMGSFNQASAVVVENT